MAAWIKMALATEVGLGPGDSLYAHTVDVLTTNLGIKIVHKDIPTRRSVAFLQLWPNGRMDQDAT